MPQITTQEYEELHHRLDKACVPYELRRLDANTKVVDKLSWQEKLTRGWKYGKLKAIICCTRT